MDDAKKQLLTAAMIGKTGDIEKLLAAGISPATEKIAVVQNILPALDMTRTDLSLFRLLNLHPDTEKISAPLYLAALQGHADVVDIFLQQKNTSLSLNVGLVGAVMGGHMPLVQKFLQAGADVSFEDYTPLAESIAGTAPAITTLLQNSLSKAQVPAAHTRALQACIGAGKPEKTVDYLSVGVDVFPALKAACQALCTQQVMRPAHAAGATVADYEDALEMILGFAEAGGGSPQFESDMKNLAATLLPTAIQEKATPVVQRLLDYGADADKVLDYAVTQGLLPLAAKALMQGAEPRRDAQAVVARAKELAAFIGDEHRRDLRDLLVQVVEVRTESDRATLQAAGDLSVTVLRQTLCDETAKTGLMLAIETGQAEKSLNLFLQNPAALTPEFLLQKDISGRSALSRLCDKEQGALVLAASYWHGRPEAYEKVMQAVLALSPAAQKEDLEKTGHETRQGLAARQNQQALDARAKQARNRLRFK